ncbi:MAG: hypothetical protein ACK5XO_08290, partial [Phycisphaerales bacterium]
QMSPALVKLVAMLLLVVQGAIASAPGRVLCIPVGDCGTHESETAEVCSHCDTQCMAHAGSGVGAPGHDEGPYSTAFHPDDECGCHLHVPVPGDEQVPSNPKGEGPDSRTFLLPLAIAVVMAWDFDPPVAVPPRVQPPDFSASDQVLGLKTTRLLI